MIYTLADIKEKICLISVFLSYLQYKFTLVRWCVFCIKSRSLWPTLQPTAKEKLYPGSLAYSLYICHWNFILWYIVCVHVHLGDDVSCIKRRPLWPTLWSLKDIKEKLCQGSVFIHYLSLEPHTWNMGCPWWGGVLCIKGMSLWPIFFSTFDLHFKKKVDLGSK